jgi:MFS family permease
MEDIKQASSKSRDIDDVRTTPYSWLVATLAMIVYTSSMVCNMVWGTAIPIAYEQLGFTMLAAGGLSTAYAVGGIICMWFLSFLVDKFGARKVMTLSVVFTGLFSLAIPFAPGGYWMSFTLRVLAGLCAGPMFPGVIKIQNTWFGPRTRATAFGFMTAAPPLGGAISAAVFAPVVAQDWKMGFVIAGVAAVIIGIIFFAFARDKIAEKTTQPSQAEPATEKGAVRKAVFEFITKRSFIFAGLAYLLAIGQGMGFNIYAMSYFTLERGFSLETSGLILGGTTLIGLVAGAIAGGAADLLRWKKLCLWIGSIMSVICTILVMISTDIAVLSLTLLLRNLFGAFLSIPLSAMMGENAKGPNESARMGLYVSLGTIGGIIFPLLFGILLDATGNNFSLMMICIAIACGLVGVCVTFVDEVRPPKKAKTNVTNSEV